MNTQRIYPNNNIGGKRIKKNRLTVRKYKDPAIEFRQHLFSLYPECKFDRGIVDYNDYPDDNVTYGEMEYNGIDQLYDYVMSLEKKDSNQEQKYAFIDIGAGRGKICIYMASKPNITQSNGIELVKLRHIDSISLLQSFSKRKRFRPFLSKINFYNENMFHFNFRDSLQDPSQKCFIWINDLCFELETINKLFIKLSEDLEPNSIISCNKMPAIDQAPFSKHFKLINTLSIPMSWNKNGSDVFIIQKL